MRNSKSQIAGFLADLVLKFSTEIDIFINTPKTEFSNFSIDSAVQCCPEKEILCKTLLMLFNGKIF